MLTAVMLSFIMLSDFMMSFIIASVLMLSDFMLSFIFVKYCYVGFHYTK
jgi:hypothetical protein